MHEITNSDIANPDILVEIIPTAVLIHYHGEQIYNWTAPVKIYLTAEGNPHYLKQAVILSVDNINEIQRANKLPEWPNPIILDIQNPEDTSVYIVKSNIKVAVKRV
jgi:hypothetical protein